MKNKTGKKRDSKVFAISVCLGICIGVAFGTGFEVALKNIWILPIGISFGTVGGVIIGGILYKRGENHRRE